jgi:hypothetical protein
MAAALAGISPAGGGGTTAKAATAPAATAPAPSALVSGWGRWRLGPRGAARAVDTTRRGRLELRLKPAAPAGATAWYRLIVPRGAPSTAIAFDASFATPRGVQVFVAAGTPSRKVWTRSGGRRVSHKVIRARLGNRRVVYVGITRRTAPARSATTRGFLAVHSYAIGGASVRIPPGSLAAGRAAGNLAGGPAGAGDAYTGPRIYWGARIGGGEYGAGFGDAPWDMRTLAMFESHAGKGASIVLWGQPWYAYGTPQGFDAHLFEEIRAHGAIPMIDWSPWDLAARGSPQQPDFQLQDVIGGAYDEYIRQWAAAAAAWGKPFFLRFCHEMNGSWYPWSERSNGNSAGEFVRAWRRVHDIFAAAGATNVTWVWSPNEFESYNGIPIAGLYPGDAYVDWVGMSGYNWGNGQRGSLWRTFAKTFTRTYAAIRALVPGKPLMISEVASSERGGSKAEWLQDAFGVQLPTRFPAVKAVVWWNKRDEEMDWPIESSAPAQAAFAQAISSPYYMGNRLAGLARMPIPPP